MLNVNSGRLKRRASAVVTRVSLTPRHERQLRGEKRRYTMLRAAAPPCLICVKMSSRAI